MPFSRRQLLQAIAAGSILGAFPAKVVKAQNTPPPPLIVDGHLDLGWNMVNYGRDYSLRAETIRQSEGRTIAGEAMLGLPNLFEGGVGLLFGVIFTMPQRYTTVPHRAVYTNAQEAYAWGQQMLMAIKAFADSQERVRFVQDTATLDAVLATWQDNVPDDERLLGIILAMEGADPILSPDTLSEWVEQGLRCIGPAWASTRYAGGTNGGDAELTGAGRALLAEMAQYNLLLDTAHLTESVFWQALLHWDGPIVYSHGNSRHFLPDDRGLSDNQIDALVERNGVIGIGLYDGFFRQQRIDPNQVTLDDVGNAIDYICQRTGTCEHVAIGSDIDGGFGAEASPIDTASDLPDLTAILRGRGYAASDIEAILSGNWLRKIREVML